jgi:hypothetical protein
MTLDEEVKFLLAVLEREDLARDLNIVIIGYF